MTKIYCYDKKSEPVEIAEAKEIATLGDGLTYIAVPDAVDCSKDARLQPVDGATLGKEFSATMKALKTAWADTKTINEQVVAKIREKYSVDDELQILRTGNGFDEYNNYAESCVEWGRTVKGKWGV